MFMEGLSKEKRKLPVSDLEEECSWHMDQQIPEPEVGLELVPQKRTGKAQCRVMAVGSLYQIQVLRDLTIVLNYGRGLAISFCSETTKENSFKLESKF